MTTPGPGEGYTLSGVFTTIASAVPDNVVMVQGERRQTYAQTDAHIDAVAHFLVERGLGCHTERHDLEGHESGQDHVGLYLRNCPEYLEGMVAAFRARTVPVNINYRYVTEELRYLLHDSGVKALIYGAEFAGEVAALRDELPALTTLIQVPDGSGNALLPGAVEYGDVLQTPCPPQGMPTPQGEDAYVLYTGGTTGMPKGVLWRQHDIYVSSMGGTPFGATEPFASYEAIAEHARSGGSKVTLLMTPPMMHGAAQWSGFHIMTGGGTLVLLANTQRLDPVEALTLIGKEGVVSLPVVGDAIALPIIEEVERAQAAGQPYDLSSLASVNNGSAALTPAVKSRIFKALPNVIVLDVVGASETGMQMSSFAFNGAEGDAATFAAQPDTAVVDDGFTRLLEPGEGGGWLARKQTVPMGYLGDPEKTARTFPLIDGVRWAIPGDRAEILDDGRIVLLGRDSVTINTGGEKVFVEEVERALIHHPAVRDAIVVGRPSTRWGSEVVAVVALDEDASDESLLAEAAKHLARYKLPKEFIRVPAVVRSPSGKADYRWAKSVATS
ncbi:MAG: acyl-CoA synthetase [Marmoricola sp.]